MRRSAGRQREACQRDCGQVARKQQNEGTEGAGVSEIYVDADACPVKDEVLRVAARHGVKVTFVANFGLRPSRDPLIAHVVVPQGADAADDWIVEHVRAGDIVVTADIPLARRVLGKGAVAMGPTGRAFTESSIGMALAMRELNQHLRETGESRGLNPGFTARDRSSFLQALDEAVARAKRG
jgi:uncharacterized protein YaiI (UPF0178 family)